MIQCHLDPSDGHMGVAAISLFLRDAGRKSRDQTRFLIYLFMCNVKARMRRMLRGVE